MNAFMDTVSTWRFAILYFLLFSINALCTSITAALVGSDWANLDRQSKFMICIAVLANWTGCLLAFISKAAKKVESGQPLFSDTTFITKETTTVTKDKV
jgi:hypothetical protein